MNAGQPVWVWARQMDIKECCWFVSEYQMSNRVDEIEEDGERHLMTNSLSAEDGRVKKRKFYFLTSLWLYILECKGWTDRQTALLIVASFVRAKTVYWRCTSRVMLLECSRICCYLSVCTVYRVGQIKWHHFTFLLVTHECIHKILWFLTHINYIMQKMRWC